jgi:phage/plasmid-associated DNA primase
MSDELRDEIQELTSPIHGFLAECCDTTDRHACVPRADLYAAFTRWCKTRGRDHPGTEEQFGQRLNAAMPSIRSTRPRVDNPKRLRLYHGVSLNVGL